jgi:hypothetical protein
MRSCFGSVVGDSGNHPFLLPSPDERTVEQTGPDWTGLPTRALACLGRRQALAILDGQRGLQEEYLEWRVVRASDDRIRRVELTTELRGYWRVLAARAGADSGPYQRVGEPARRNPQVIPTLWCASPPGGSPACFSVALTIRGVEGRARAFPKGLAAPRLAGQPSPRSRRTLPSRN